MTSNIARPRGALLAGAMAFAVALSACSSEPQSEAAEEAGVMNKTLASALAEDEDHSAVADALKQTDLAQIFDGTAAYTVLVPSNDAFTALTNSLDMTDEDAALLAGLLRNHILPGALAPDDIKAAIETQGGEVRMKTMGKGTVSFSMAGDQLQVSGADGSMATVTAAPLMASNGVAIPIDAVLASQ